MTCKPTFKTLSFTLAILLALSVEADQYKLEKIHQRIEHNFPDVEHIDAAGYRQVVAEEDNSVVVFDVREQSEFDVSHLDGAIRVDPGISQQKFNQLYGDSVLGKTVVFYCSVGRRSSLLADRVSEELSARGTKDIYNLRYGIFGWHNGYGELVDRDSNTDYVHPYNWRWGRLLERRDLLRYDTE